MECTSCREDKAEECFSFKNKAKGLRSTICKYCHKSYAKKHYEQNKEQYKQRAKASTVSYVDRNKELTARYLMDKACIICGEKDIVVLDFDHRDPTTKRDSVSSMLRTGFAWKTILEEIEKCDVLCSNCHRRKTAKQFGTFRALFGA